MNSMDVSLLVKELVINAAFLSLVRGSLDPTSKVDELKRQKLHDDIKNYIVEVGSCNQCKRYFRFRANNKCAPVRWVKLIN